MTKSITGQCNKCELYRLAEHQLSQMKPTVTLSDSIDPAKLLHELQVHQIELEMQNQQLQSQQLELENKNARLIAKQAELNNALDRYTDFYDFAPLAYFTLDVQSNIIHANHAAARLFDLERPDLYKLRFIASVQDDLRHEFSEFLEKTISSGVQQSAEFILVIKGRSIFIKMEASPELNGRFCKAIVIDISELKQIKQALQKENEKNKAFLMNASDGVTIMNLDGYIVEVSDSFCAMLGYSRQEMIGMHVSQWDAAFKPSDLMPAVRQQFEKKIRSQFETSHRRKDGSIYDAEISGFPVEIAGEQFLFNSTRDITDRKSFEKRLSGSENEFRLLAESMPQIVWVCDANGLNTYFNQQWVDYTGLSLQESNGHGWNKPFHPDDRQRAFDAWQNAITNNAPYTLECRLRRTDGIYRWWLIRGVPTLDGEGKILKWFGTCTDIEDIKQSETQLQIAAERARNFEVLRESEERFRTLADNIPQLCWMADSTGWVFWYNKRWYDYTGATPEQMEGWGWRSVHNPEELPQIIGKWRDSLSTGKPFDMIFSLRGSDGVFRPFLTRVLPVFGQDGKIARWFGSNTDITDQKKAEQALLVSEDNLRKSSLQLKTFINQAPVSIAMFDTEMNYLAISNRWLIDHGRGNAGLIGRNHYQEHPDLPEEWKSIHRQGMAGETIKNDDDLWVHADGSRRWLRWAVVPWTGENGSISGIIIFTEDITERKLAEQALREADHRKDEFLAMLAHELRNPLTPISNAAQILAMPKLDETRILWVQEIIQRQVTHLIGLVDDLLDVTRIATGKIALKKEQLELTEIVKNVVSLVSTAINAKLHSMNLRQPAIPILIEGDRVRITQILNNLLDNAIKYTPEGGLIEVNVYPVDTDVEIQIRDQGVGISAELLPKVFDLFRQAETTLDRSRGGLGIGLTLVKKLVDMHGGQVTATSKGIGHGSTFTVRLPLVAESINLLVAETSTLPEHHRNTCILVVDDDRNVRETLAVFLQMKGYKVLMANNGESAIKLTEDFQPDVVLLDIGLPGENGYQVCKRIRCLPNGSDLFVVAVSGYGHPEALARSKAEGFDNHLVKPLNFNALFNLLAGQGLT